MELLACFMIFFSRILFTLTLHTVSQTTSHIFLSLQIVNMLVQSSVSLMFQLTDRKEANLQDLLYLYFTSGVASCSREGNVTAWMASQYLNSSARSYQFKAPKALFPKCFLLRSHLHALSQTTLNTVGTSFRSSPGSTF